VRKSRTCLAFAAAVAVAPAQANFDFGVGNTQLSPTDPNQETPFSTQFNCSSFQQIVTAAELQAQGVQPGWRIASTWLIFDAAPGLHWQNVAVFAGNTSNAYFTQLPQWSAPKVQREWGLWPLRAPQQLIDVAGWNVFDSTQNVFWDGVSNIVVEFLVTGGAAEYPNGTPDDYAGALGPTVRATTYAPPAGPGTYRGCTSSLDHSWFTSCQTNDCNPVNAVFDMRLVFAPGPANDSCSAPFALTESSTALQQMMWGGTTTPGLPGNPELADEVWYSLRNDHLNPRQFTVSGCGPNGFDTAAAVFRGSCGALVFEAFDDDGCGTPGSGFHISFDLQPNETALVAVGRFAQSPMPNISTYYVQATSTPFASTAVLGAGCGFGGASPPQLSGTTPHLGSVGTISLTGAPPLSALVLLLGPPAPGATFLGTGCPFHLDLASSFILQVALTDAAGAWSFSDQLPSATELVGVSVALQVVLISALHAPPIGTSSAVLLTFGA
jgi:hypothetical protein